MSIQALELFAVDIWTWMPTTGVRLPFTITTGAGALSGYSTVTIALPDQTVALNYFEALEKVWEKEKENYTRVYFLTQKVILQEICRRLCIPSSQPSKRPISDLRRYKAQIKIFNALWNIVLVNKYESTPRRRPTVLQPICA